MILQMINWGKPHHLLHPRKSNVSLKLGRQNKNISKHGYRKTLLLECAGGRE